MNDDDVIIASLVCCSYLKELKNIKLKVPKSIKKFCLCLKLSLDIEEPCGYSIFDWTNCE